MQINIKTSEDNKVRVQELTRKFKFGAENVIARLAFAYSLSKNLKLDPNNIRDSKGKEYKDDILFGDYRSYYISLICQHYEIHKSDLNIGKYIKMHIDHGLEIMDEFFKANQNTSGFQFMLDCVENGIDLLENTDIPMHVKNFHQKIQSGFYDKIITLEMGNQIENKSQKVCCSINDTKMYDNAHLAVAGNSGTGKTQFALSMLKQFSNLSNQQIKFLYLDFKGVKDEDKKELKNFLEITNCSLIDTPHIPFPLNPLSFIDSINEKNRLLGINKFVDIIEKHADLGKNQEQILKEATKEAFIDTENGQFPTFADIYEKLQSYTEGKPSKLNKIIQDLSEFDIFDNKIKSDQSFIDKNYYFSLSGDLPSNIRFTSVFLVINYIYNVFMNMSNAPVVEDAQALRYVLLIDEAHVIFREKKSHDILQSILREIRSKGVSVILLSQGIEEFNQPTFDFSSMCQTAILFDIKDKTNIRSMQKFLGLGEKDSHILARSMEKIQKGQAISNLKELRKSKHLK